MRTRRTTPPASARRSHWAGAPQNSRSRCCRRSRPACARREPARHAVWQPPGIGPRLPYASHDVRALAVGLAAAVLVVAGCGESSDETGGAQPDTTIEAAEESRCVAVRSAVVDGIQTGL